MCKHTIYFRFPADLSSWPLSNLKNRSEVNLLSHCRKQLSMCVSWSAGGVHEKEILSNTFVFSVKGYFRCISGQPNDAISCLIKDLNQAIKRYC